jgi:hypothetical protein
VRYRGPRVEPAPTIGKRIRRHVEDTHYRGPIKSG